MGETKEKICRLCLNYEDTNFTNLEMSSIGKVKAIIPELALKYPEETLICSKCKEILDKCFELKRTFSKNNDLIQNEKNRSRVEKVDLNSVIKDGFKRDENICRICLNRTGGRFVSIKKDGNDDFNNVLNYCVPELDLDLTPKPVACSSCRSLLYEMYNFKKECLSVDEKIQSYYGSSVPKKIDLNKILILTRTEDENDFLSGFEVQDEEGTDIFDNIPEAEEENRKRSASESVETDQLYKRQKLMAAEITDEELPHFHFDVHLLFTSREKELAVEDWLDKVEEYRQKFGWSDYVTIHKVLVKLKDMKELYVWFSNIADIMDWEQWRKKLVRAFPPKTDYHIPLKKMVNRRKRKDETYVTYYTEKMKLMEPLGLTDEQKVSCIFGGVSDVLVCCVGRVGNYKNPEDLLDYFKSCDDKQSVEAAGNDGKPEPKAEKVAKFQPLQGEKKKARKKCYDCRRYGHSQFECRLYTIAAHLDRAEEIKPQNNPKLSESRARRPPKRDKSTLNCLKCGVLGHLMRNCPLIPKPTPAQPKPKPQQKSPSKKQRQRAAEARALKEKMSHERYEKLERRPTASKSTTSYQKPKKEVNNSFSRCRACGRYGSSTNPCCSERMFDSRYVDSYSAPSIEYSKQVCLRCYQPGHPTKDCDEYARRMYRN